MLVRCLVLLGVGAQLWIFHALRFDPPVLVGGDIGDSLAGITIYCSPMLLAVGGAVLARWLHRRGPGWALLAAGVPCAVLLLGIGLAAYLTLTPVCFD